MGALTLLQEAAGDVNPHHYLWTLNDHAPGTPERAALVAAIAQRLPALLEATP